MRSIDDVIVRAPNWHSVNEPYWKRSNEARLRSIAAELKVIRRRTIDCDCLATNERKLTPNVAQSDAKHSSVVAFAKTVVLVIAAMSKMLEKIVPCDASNGAHCLSTDVNDHD